VSGSSVSGRTSALAKFRDRSCRHADYRLANIAQRRHEYPSRDPAHCSRGYKEQPDNNQELSDNDQEYPPATHEPRPLYGDVVLPNASPISGVTLRGAHGFTPEGCDSEEPRRVWFASTLRARQPARRSCFGPTTGSISTASDHLSYCPRDGLASSFTYLRSR
jgi:hypothetical protein